MGTQNDLGGDKTVKPGPEDYCTGRVRQPTICSFAPFPKPSLKHLPLPLGLLRTKECLTGVTSCRTAVLLPSLVLNLSRGKARTHLFPSTLSAIKCYGFIHCKFFRRTHFRRDKQTQVPAFAMPGR